MFGLHPSFFFSFLLENIMKMKSFIPAVVALTLSVSALSSMAATPDELLGDPVPAAAPAERTIAITPDTKYVNVEGDLNKVAPPGLLDHPVTAYVSPNPMYMG
jgi:hypothetical protein